MASKMTNSIGSELPPPSPKKCLTWAATKTLNRRLFTEICDKNLRNRPPLFLTIFDAMSRTKRRLFRHLKRDRPFTTSPKYRNQVTALANGELTQVQQVHFFSKKNWLKFISSPRREESAEMAEVKALYTAARRRIQELEQTAKENNETYDENVRLLRHEKQVRSRNLKPNYSRKIKIKPKNFWIQNLEKKV